MFDRRSRVETDGNGPETDEVRFSVAENGDVRNGTDENGRERAETDEIKNLKRQLQGTKQWMKAPDGTRTNLTESQWLQVRTESFKKWFGDWELAALLNNSKKAWNDNGFTFTYRFSPSVELKERLEDLLGHTVNILQIDGSTVRHIKNEHSDIKSETKKGQKARTAEDIVLIPYLLNNFDEAELSPKHDDNLGNRAITIKKQINGVSVIGTIERGKNGVYVVTNWQIVSAVQMQTTPGRNALSDADKSKIQQDIAKIKTGAENFSKIVDENGEPLVVYHGTDADFYSFDTKNGAWFSRSMEYAESMMEERNGKNLLACYLAIKNPMIVKADPQKFAADIAWEKSLIAEARTKGHDGLIIENNTDNDLEKDVFYVAFSPEQIKLAGNVDTNGELIPGTGNIGTFDPQNPDIRFSISEYSAEEVRDYVDILKPFTGAVIDRNPEDYAAYLKEHGVDIPEKDAFRFAQEAAGEKMKQARKAADKEAAKQLKLKSLSSILSIWSTRSIKMPVCFK